MTCVATIIGVCMLLACPMKSVSQGDYVSQQDADAQTSLQFLIGEDRIYRVFKAALVLLPVEPPSNPLQQTGHENEGMKFPTCGVCRVCCSAKRVRVCARLGSHNLR